MNIAYQDYIGLIQTAITTHWHRPAFTDYQAATLHYKDVARKIEKIHILLEKTGIRQGDKIAICGRNSSHWAVVFLAAMTYGAVPVPILHEFKPEQVHNIVNHSESRLFFVEDGIWEKLDAALMPAIEGFILLSDLLLAHSRCQELTQARERLNELYGQKYPNNFRPQHVRYATAPDGEALAIINYTSGTTSNSKGVLIPYRALWSNFDFARLALPNEVKAGDRVLSMLPMAHMYGMAFEFLFEFLTGVQVYFLNRLPSPQIIVQAFAEIKPKIIFSVPLIIEKIIKKRVLPKLETPSMKLLLRLPIINEKIRQKVKMEIEKVFGRDFYEIIVGGAALNSEIEEFLHKIGFRYTVGYGATECAPIIAYAPWDSFAKGSCGRVVPHMEVRIDHKNSTKKEGEILVRGANVMLGYYKNPEATAAVLDSEGWYHTGDLGVMDKAGNIYIRGRSKNMLLGSNGQNIYPEEIEDRLNTLPYVQESIVIQKQEKLYALIYPDYEEAKKDGLDENALHTQMERNRQELNKMINAYEQVVGFRLYEQEFEKTPKRSIKRFLYENAEV